MYAVFPLNLVVLPGEKVALHLFEPRYKQLFQDHRSGKEFVILHQSNGQIAKTGTVVCIEKVIQVMEDGMADIVVRGKSACSILTFSESMEDKLYGGVSAVPFSIEDHLDPRILQMAKEYFREIGKAVSWDDVAGSYDILCELDRDEFCKLRALEAKSSEQLNHILANEIKLLNQVRMQESLLSQRYHLN